MATIDPTALEALPIFPLPHAVLFPGALLPLHVFEPRYRDLTRDALAGTKLLAVARLQPGYTEEEYLGNPRVFDVAGLGSIVASDQLPDGRYYMVLRGIGRIHIEEELETDCSYRKVRARILQDQPLAGERGTTSHEQLIALCDRLSMVVRSESGAELRRLARSSDEPGACADLVAAALIDEPDERQRLLEQLNPTLRLEHVSNFVARLIGDLDPDREMLN